MIKNFICMMFLLSLIGCAAVDLRGKEKYNTFSPAAHAQGKKILTESASTTGVLDHWSKFSQFTVLTTDHWSNMIFRWLTPVQTAHQKLFFTFDIATDNSFMTYMDGKTPWDSVGIKNGKTYKIIKGEWIQRNFGDVQRYVGHVRNYFLFPQTIKDYPVTAYIGESLIGGVTYDKIFAGISDAPANVQADQYVVWVNRQTKRIDYIEFTIRDFFPSLHGVIVYKDYRQVEGMWLPFEIVLPASMANPKQVHRFTVDKIELKTSSS